MLAKIENAVREKKSDAYAVQIKIFLLSALKAIFHSAKYSDQTNFFDRKFLFAFFSLFSIWRAYYFQL